MCAQFYEEPYEVSSVPYAETVPLVYSYGNPFASQTRSLLVPLEGSEGRSLATS